MTKDGGDYTDFHSADISKFCFSKKTAKPNLGFVGLPYQTILKIFLWLGKQWVSVFLCSCISLYGAI